MDPTLNLLNITEWAFSYTSRTNEEIWNIFSSVECSWSQDSSVSTATSYGWTNRSSISGRCERFFSTRPRPHRLWCPQNFYPMDTEEFFPKVKRQGREADHSPSSTTEVKNGGIIHPIPHTYLWFGAYIIKHRNKLRGLSPQARTIPTERPPLVGEVSANFSG
jgi:hypothetical protein